MSEWIKNTGVMPVDECENVRIRFFNGVERNCSAGSYKWHALDGFGNKFAIESWRKIDTSAEPVEKQCENVHFTVPDMVKVDTECQWSIATAHALLQTAAKHMSDRAATYDTPEGERSMGKAVTAFNAITGHKLTEAEGWLLMQVLKDVRLFTRDAYHADSAEDCIAYAALKAEAKASEDHGE